MLLLRSVAFNVAFYVNLALWLIGSLPTLVLHRRYLAWIMKAWARSNLLLLRVVAGVECEMRGLERVPAGGLLIAAKHQSAWETFALFLACDDLCYILKRELLWVPLFGWYCRKARMIPVDRARGAAAMAGMLAAARRALAEGRQICIFPEGTRTLPGARPAYKPGVALLYDALAVPCVPVALNSGVHWPRRSWLKRPGTIVIDVLDPLPAGLGRRPFLRRVQQEIEAASDRLLAGPGRPGP